MDHVEPLVSVVIPTRNRSHLVARAVYSALTQTLATIEVIVVIDGPDEATSQVLCQIDDFRLRVKTLPKHLGSGGARNTGVDEARSQWVAFLDDDDEWFPQKLESQLQTARQSDCLYPIISCRFIGRSDVGDFVWPCRLPELDEPLSEYLFCQKRGLFRGEGLVHPSTILTTKELVQRVPFRGLQRLEDIDWLLRAVVIEGARVEFVPNPAPLAIWHLETSRDRTSNKVDWGISHSLSWIQTNQHLVTSRAYASFVLMWLGSYAASRKEERRVFLPLLLEAYRRGKPTIIDTWLYLMIWLIPQRVRRKVASYLETYRSSERR